MFFNSEGAFDSWATRFGAMAVLQLLWENNTPSTESFLYFIFFVSTLTLLIAALFPLWTWKAKLAVDDSHNAIVPAFGLVFLTFLTVCAAVPSVMPMVNISPSAGLLVFFVVAVVLSLPVIIIGRNIERERKAGEEQKPTSDAATQTATAEVGRGKPGENYQRPALSYTVGDTVKLKSGGPLMTVETISAFNTHCVWFEGDVAKKGNFDHKVCEKVPT